MKNIDIGKYVKDYEERKIIIEEIAKKEEVSIRTIASKLDKYYEKQGIQPKKFSIGPRKKAENIEKYVEDYEKGTIHPWQIAAKEGVSEATIITRLKEYYAIQGKQLPKPKRENVRKKVNIEKYVEDYEKGTMHPSQIAVKEGVCEATIINRLKEYYATRGKQMPKSKRKTVKKQIDIGKYIKEFEEGKILLEEIAIKENVSCYIAKKRFEEYYCKKGLKAPKSLYRTRKQINNNKKYEKLSDVNHTNKSETTVEKQISKSAINTIKTFLKRGLTKEEIKSIAEKRRIIIPDELFEQISKDVEYIKEEER